MTASVPRRWLWITPAITDRRSTGALVYSLSLADAVAAQGVDVTCVGLGSIDVDAPPCLTYERVESSPRPGWRALVSPLPNQASATATRAFRDRVDELLGQGWDAVVVDGLQVGWLVSRLDRDTEHCVVYVAHNHESSMRVQIARNTRWATPRRPLLELDALKTRRIENALVRRADVVSSISAADRDRFEQQGPHARHVVVPPGWSAPSEPAVAVDMGERPRRVGILGSFEWHAKQEGLRRFLAVADPAFAAADIELVIAGKVPDGFRRDLGDLQATSFLGWVASPAALLASCRIGAIAEPLGGGFKLKALDYVFSDVVVATLAHSAEGLPFTAGSSMIVEDDESRLAAAIVQAIDDPPLLRRIAAEARSLAEGVFTWDVAAQALVAAVDARVTRSESSSEPRV